MYFKIARKGLSMLFGLLVLGQQLLNNLYSKHVETQASRTTQLFVIAQYYYYYQLLNNIDTTALSTGSSLLLEPCNLADRYSSSQKHSQMYLAIQKPRHQKQKRAAGNTWLQNQHCVKIERAAQVFARKQARSYLFSSTEVYNVHLEIQNLDHYNCVKIDCVQVCL